jgi:ParB-like chromosome segregation protein Spo0J
VIPFDGHTRLRARKVVGLKTIPAVLHDFEDESVDILSRS